MKVVLKPAPTELSALTLTGVALTLTVAAALTIAVWSSYGPVPALVAALVLAVAGTAWARSVEREQQLLTRPTAPGPARFRDPEDQEV